MLMRSSINRYRFLKCMCCDQDYGVQLGQYCQQCDCSGNFCRRCNKCEKCCKCKEGILDERRPKKYRCYSCDEIIQGTEKFCPHCGASLKD